MNVPWRGCGPWVLWAAILEASLVMSGCGGRLEPENGVEFTGATRQITGYKSASPATPQLWIIVVDDAPTVEGRQLRAQAAQEFPGWVDRLRDDSCVRAVDRAEYFPLNIQVLVVPSSDALRTIHPIDNPHLALVTDNATSEGAHDWELAVAAVIERTESQSLLPNRLVDAWSYWDDVLSGKQLPARPADEDLVRGIEHETLVSIYAVTTRDDMSERHQPEFDFGSARVANGQFLIRNERACSNAPVEALAPRLWGKGELRRCDDSLFDSGVVCDFVTSCNGGTVRVDEQGQAACRVLAYSDPSLPCPKEAGWSDPLDENGVRASRVEPPPFDWFEGNARVCEVLQLEGAANESCKHNAACSACTPGWCLLDSHPSCIDPNTWSWAQLRFVSGSNIPRQALMSIKCDLETQD